MCITQFSQEMEYQELEHFFSRDHVCTNMPYQELHSMSVGSTGQRGNRIGNQAMVGRSVATIITLPGSAAITLLVMSLTTMASWNGKILCVTDPLCVRGIHRWSVVSHHEGSVTQSFDVCYDGRLNKRLVACGLRRYMTPCDVIVMRFSCAEFLRGVKHLCISL